MTEKERGRERERHVKLTDYNVSIRVMQLTLCAKCHHCECCLRSIWQSCPPCSCSAPQHHTLHLNSGQILPLSNTSAAKQHSHEERNQHKVCQKRTVSIQQLSKHFCLSFFSRFTNQRPPFLFLGSSHIGSMPSYSVGTANKQCAR